MRKGRGTVASIYDTLSKALKIKPADDEDEQDFYARAVKAGSKLDDKKFEALPEECRDWLDEATSAVKEETDIPSMPGAPFEDDDDDDGVVDDGEEAEDDPDDTDAEEEDDDPPAEDDEEEEAPPPKAKGKAKAEAKPAAKAAAKPVEKAKAKAAAPVAGKKKAAPAPAEDDEEEEPAPKAKAKAKAAPEPKAKPKAKDTEKKAEKKNKVVRAGRARSTDGVLYKLMESLHEDPTRSAKDIKTLVEKEHKIKVKDSNAVGIRQQYRRVVMFLQDQDALKKDLIKSTSAD
jgi:hypothetical protein